MVERELSGSDHWTRFYWGVLEGNRVGGAVLQSRPWGGYMQGAWVLPTARGHGVYRAMLHARLVDLSTRGIPAATIWAERSTSAPIAERAGFSGSEEVKFFELPPG